MKKCIIILVVFTVQISFAQVSNNKTQVSTTVKELQDEIAILKSQIKQIENFKNEQLEIVKQTTLTIENQNSLINSFSLIYVIITIIIAIVAIGLPLFTYQFGIKPSRNALKELENNLDKKVANYLKETRQEQIKKSIEYLKGENPELKDQAISFLSLTQHEGYTDQELFEFYRLIKSGKLSNTHTGAVAYMLSSRVNEYANEIFSDKEQFKNNSLKAAALQYISKANIEKFILPLKGFISESNNQYGDFFNLLTFTNLYSENIVKRILDINDLIDCLTEVTLKQIKSNIKFFLDNLKIDQETFNKSYLGIRINNIGG